MRSTPGGLTAWLTLGCNAARDGAHRDAAHDAANGQELALATAVARCPNDREGAAPAS
jgi:hypothetical protein